MRIKKQSKMSLHVFATIMALYPFTSSEDISEEFGLSIVKIRRMARICRVKKAEDYRHEILTRNCRKAVERNIERRIRRERKAIKMWNEGLSMGEIAKKLRLSKDTVYRYLLNAKKRGIKLKR